MILEPFLLRALAAAVGLAVVAAPLGCIVVWQRMAYFGETIAQASLIGVALGLAFDVNLNLSIFLVALAVALLIITASRQKNVPVDSILGLMHHGALAIGIIATAVLAGPSVDLVGYLFGDIYAVSWEDLIWVYGGGALVLGSIVRLWPSLLRLAVHEELAAAEGVGRNPVRIAFTLLLSVAIAVAIKIIGILLIIAFLIVPVVAARPLSGTPERMAVLTAVIAVASAIAGIALSSAYDVPGGPAIVLVMAGAAALSLAASGLRAS